MKLRQEGDRRADGYVVEFLGNGLDRADLTLSMRCR